ncbi:MAG: NAD-dependent epimerase/dehydratase family protein [Faecousia sp.]
MKQTRDNDCRRTTGKFIFSSSATVYGPNNPHPYKEDMPAIQSSSPYGWTKVMIERILTDYVTAHDQSRLDDGWHFRG